MIDRKVDVGEEGLLRLQSAAQDFAHPEVDRIVQAGISTLQLCSAEGVLEEVHACQLWDEYCWVLQEGPFDIEMGVGDVSFGSLPGAFEDILNGVIVAEVEAFPNHMQIFLSALAIEEKGEPDECGWGSVRPLLPSARLPVV